MPKKNANESDINALEELSPSGDCRLASPRVASLFSIAAFLSRAAIDYWRWPCRDDAVTATVFGQHFYRTNLREGTDDCAA